MFITDFLRNRALKKHRSQVRTNITPLKDIRTAVTVIDVEDTSFDNCKKDIMAFYRDNGIKGEIFFFDFRKLTEGERLITSITTTILKKDLNWYGRPSKEKIGYMLDGEPDLFISLLPRADYTIEFMAKCSKAHFKIGRCQLPGNTFDIVVLDSPEKPHSEAEVFKEMAAFIKKIR
jgi:hypothetical protein